MLEDLDPIRSQLIKVHVDTEHCNSYSLVRSWSDRRNIGRFCGDIGRFCRDVGGLRRYRHLRVHDGLRGSIRPRRAHDGIVGARGRRDGLVKVRVAAADVDVARALGWKFN